MTVGFVFATVRSRETVLKVEASVLPEGVGAVNAFEVAVVVVHAFVVVVVHAFVVVVVFAAAVVVVVVST